MKKSVPTFVPDVPKSLAFMEKDSKRFPNTQGWAYAKFEKDATSKMFKPSVTASNADMRATRRWRLKITSLPQRGSNSHAAQPSRRLTTRAR